jgi:holo-[acyl-carrier protein] synthase
MILRTGNDLMEIDRIGKWFRHGKTTRTGLHICRAECGKRAESLAGRFAAKEAVAKALGCGIGEVTWKEIEILGDEQHAPVLHLHGNAAQKADELGLTNWSVSLSHSQSHAVAVVVMVG